MRRILCQSCASGFNLHPEDEIDGWQLRKIDIPVQVPTDGSHRVVIETYQGVVSDTPVPIIVCDTCNDEIPEGTIGVAVTMWRGLKPDNWEEKYTKK